MKLRILNNSIRLRLSKKEVDKFAQIGRIDAVLEFAAKTFHYQLSYGDSQEFQAKYQENTIQIIVPKPIALTWASSEQVGIEGLISFQNTKTLKILVEKDFQCLTKRPGEDDLDTFPNPNAPLKNSEK